MKLDWRSFLIPWWISWPRKSKCTGRPCDGKNLQETKDLYNLTDAEQELLESKRRGHALFIIGSKRLHVNFEIPAYKFSYMGKAGGR